MSVVHRADAVPVAGLAEYWHHVLTDNFVPIEPIGFPDQIRAGQVGAVQVGELTARAPGGAKRTTRHIRQSDPELFKIDFVAEGNDVIEQDGRQATLSPGDFSLIDLARPAHWAMSGVRVVALLFPPAMLSLRRDELSRLSAVRMRGDRGAGALA